MTTVAESIADQLVEAGVEVVFGLPGGEIVEILDEVRRRNIDFVLVRNESSAAFVVRSEDGKATVVDLAVRKAGDLDSSHPEVGDHVTRKLDLHLLPEACHVAVRTCRHPIGHQLRGGSTSRGSRSVADRPRVTRRGR